jgi:hypothetical protein
MEFNTTITLSKQYRLQYKDSPSGGSFFLAYLAFLIVLLHNSLVEAEVPVLRQRVPSVDFSAPLISGNTQ